MTAPQLAPGTIVAQKYQIGACFGYAGSSATYQAASSDGREVVLKMFDPAIRQFADIMAAIEQTYAATNALPQDLAVPLLDAGYDPGTGAPFSVGERIPFPSLGQLVGQRVLTPEEASSMLNGLAALFDQAHPRQLFHHALKPTNVFLGFAQGFGVRVTDFGAGFVRAALPTQEGYGLAAPWFAPEQVQGASPAGAAADVFALGLILFFALTGRSYWRSCQGTLDLAGWQRELSAPRTPPSARALQLGVMLNSAFDAVITTAIATDPSQRFTSVRELAQAFEAVSGVKAPESQATMAFPASALGLHLGGGEYPPPPQPTGGYQPPPPAAGAAAGSATMAYPDQGPGPMGMGQPNPYGAQPQQGSPYGAQNAQQGPQGQPQAPQYVSTQTPGELGETAAGRPLDPAALQRRAPPNRLAPILVGVVALLLLGGGAAAWIAMGRRGHTDATTTEASASASAAPADTASGAPSGSAAAAPADSGSAAPADSGSAAPAPADSGSAAPSAEPAAAGPESTFTCDPAECDEIKIDDKVIELGKPVVLAAGKHVVIVKKDGFNTLKDTFKLKAGDKVEKTYKLKPVAAAAPAGPAVPAGPAKPCGKFLKRGAGCK
jgi:eukaryotic-like serine/threonine-protein kinase